MSKNSRKFLIQLREASNIPQLLSNAPSTNITIGWTLYNKKRPEPSKTKLSKIIKEKRNPIYNENIYIEVPQFIDKIEGFIYLCLNSNQSNTNLIEIYIPLNFIPNFYPIHFCIKNDFLKNELNFENESKNDFSKKGVNFRNGANVGFLEDFGSKNNIELFFSVVLFDIYNKKFNESLIEIEMSDFFFEPILLENFPFSICVNSSKNNKIDYIEYLINKNENINSLIIDFIEKKNPSWISYNCFFLEKTFKFNFSILKSFLNNSKDLKITIYSTDYNKIKKKSAFLKTPIANFENIDNLCKSLFL